MICSLLNMAHFFMQTGEVKGTFMTEKTIQLLEKILVSGVAGTNSCDILNNLVSQTNEILDSKEKSYLLGLIEEQLKNGIHVRRFH